MQGRGGFYLEGYDTRQFEKDMIQLGIELSALQLDQFIRYYEMLVKWNEVMNLTAVTEYNQVLKKHFVDSASLVRAYNPKESENMIDIGTGAGFPGLVLKIVFPKMRITLLDSLNKRIQFLNAVTEELNLQGISVLHGRAEDFARKEQMRENFDLCVSRAVANLSTLSEYCIPFVKPGGKFVSYKSEKVLEEVAAAQNALKMLGGKIVKQVSFYLPDSDIYRNLVVIEKIKETPKKFPRKAGLPGKEPL
nr:16S rRNA (guanine(527)-N(7))-methyltransferase RsmG [uncultured Acetatifactor sp.]